MYDFIEKYAKDCRMKLIELNGTAFFDGFVTDFYQFRTIRQT